jgi:putative NIF3 family GTP cyclohydrolase 1 type 2
LTHIKQKFNLPTLKVVGKKDKITSIALTTGAGASLIGEIEADCFLTGDIKYHDAMKALSQDLMMVDIGHYESEKFFAEILSHELKVLPILAIIANSKNPFYTQTP